MVFEWSSLTVAVLLAFITRHSSPSGHTMLGTFEM